jgi:hypothetical protein
VIGEESWQAMCYEDVLPRDIRMVGDLFADKLARGVKPNTALECWFRRVLRGIARRNRGEEYEPWVVLTAMAYSMTDLGDPVIFATYAPMPCSAIEFRHLVYLADRERPKSGDRNPV